MIETFRRHWIAASALGLLAIAGLAAATILSPGAAVAHRMLGQHGHGFFGRGHHGELDEGKLRLAAEWVLSDVDASDEQIDTIVTLSGQAMEEVRGLRAAHRDRHDAFVAALTAEQVDAVALEELRAQELLALDAASERLVQVVAAAANVLTSEQRLALVEEIESHRHRR